MKTSELDDATHRGDLEVYSSIVMQSRLPKNGDGSLSGVEPGVEVSTSKAAVKPGSLWDMLLRRALFEETRTHHAAQHQGVPAAHRWPRGVYFLKPDGKELTLRVHDECDGSDIYVSDICTCT
ncbi:hypothetical protein HYPSUDRAFT_48721 [Hypholoma sublateritium FD-334 SS-4]|uniref:Uncharacterized protein n=1 Tax=Hypholoma sublateritium (strain FD-334 SS-4) TaxID=945553 RepID=A0A0D2NEC6_HYPSF|nr:hypothetical protein HYPSUDRAFT_48721 [Hypholoma sublateritium FD-334 SS-4]